MCDLWPAWRSQTARGGLGGKARREVILGCEPGLNQASIYLSICLSVYPLERERERGRGREGERERERGREGERESTLPSTTSGRGSGASDTLSEYQGIA
eukprot:561045-Rhodomonas_salina.1